MPNTQRDKLRARPAARAATMCIGLLILAIGVVAAREQWYVNRDDNDAQPWITPALDFIGDATYQDWMMPVGFVVAFIGLIFLIIAVRNRRVTHLALANKANDDLIWFARPLDIARLCTASVQDVPGVEKAQTNVNKKAKKIVVHVTPTVDGQLSTVEEDVRQALLPIAQRLPEEPKIKIVARRTA
ncbi:MAG: hypothetical protein Q3976_02260 [Corynebacterium sp.]|nr:hypothetical protein [Corynebacterium sp.]